MMKKMLTSKDILESCLLYKKKQEDSVILKPNKDNVVNEQVVSINNSVNKTINTNKYIKFCSNVKKHFLIESLNKLFDSSIYMGFIHEDNNIIKKNVVENFVNENNVDGLLKSFPNKSLLLSEMYNIIMEAYTSVLGEVDCTNPDTFFVADEIEKKFFNDLEKLDLDDVASTIKSRVAAATNEFVESNSAAKVETKEILKKAQAKLSKLDASDGIKESYELIAKRKINAIKENKVKNILEAMIYNTSKAIVKNEELKKSYFEDGRINMDKIVESCTLLYTFLEAMNTCKVIDINEQYISDMLNEI